MKGHRIMNASGYAAPLQMVKKAIPVSGAEHVQVVDMLGARPCHRRDNFLKSAEPPVILRRRPPGHPPPPPPVPQRSIRRGAAASRGGQPPAARQAASSCR